MYKIKFVPTGHIFELPNNDAENLKKENPDEYLILEKNGKKFKDNIQIKNKKTKSILSQIIDE